MKFEKKALTQATIILILVLVLVLIFMGIFFSQASAFRSVLGIGS